MCGKRGWPALLLMLLIQTGFAQTDFIFPIRLKPDLSGGFGDLRKNHFHSGLDIRTGGKIGEPVYAIADGWVYRIKTSTQGFGNAIYLQHASGHLSAYAHLDRFSPVISDSVRNRQKLVQRTYVDWYLPPDACQVRKGDLIAWSGNSGSSGEPHLHFEIRADEEQVLNPLPFYQHLFQDQFKPVPEKIRLMPLSPDARIQGVPEPAEFSLASLGNGKYMVPDTLHITGVVGLEYLVNDRLRPEAFKLNVPEVTLAVEDSIVWRFNLRKFGFEQKRFVNDHVNYECYRLTGQTHQKCYKEDCNSLSCYPAVRTAGRLSFSDSRPHPWKLTFTDVHGNNATVSGWVRNVPPPSFPNLPEKSAQKPVIHITQGEEEIRIRIEPADLATTRGLTLVLENGEMKILKPQAWHKNTLYYSEKVSKPFPLRLQTETGTVLRRFAYHSLLLPESTNRIESGALQILVNAGVLTDTLALEISESGMVWDSWSPLYTIGQKSDPLLKPVQIHLRPTRPVAHPDKMFVARCEGQSRVRVNNAVADGQGYKGDISEWGTYCLACDLTPPVIGPVVWKPGTPLTFTVSDAGESGMEENSVSVTLNGEWVPNLWKGGPSNAQKRYIDTGQLPAGPKTLIIIATDGSGNSTTRTLELK